MAKGEGEGAIKAYVVLVWAIRWLVVSVTETRMGMGLLIKNQDFSFKHFIYMSLRHPNGTQ